MNVKQKNEIIKLFNVELAMNNTYCFNNTEKITKTYTLQFSIILNLCRPLQSLRYVDCIANCSACNHSSFSLYLSIEITVQYYNVTSLRPKSRSMFFFFFVCINIAYFIKVWCSNSRHSNSKACHTMANCNANTCILFIMVRGNIPTSYVTYVHN